MKKWLKVVLPLVVLALGVGVALLLIKFAKPVKAEKPNPLPIRVSIVTAHRTDHQYVVQTQGTVEPRTEIQLSAEVAGRITWVSPSLESGGFFEAGDKLVEVEATDYELAQVQARAQVEDARLRLLLEEAEGQVAGKEWERLGQGQPNDLLLRKPQLAQARAALAAAEARLTQATRDLERCAILAPFAGRVGDKLVDMGQFVTRGTPVARLYSVDYAEVRLPLSADQLAYVQLPLDYRGESPAEHHPAVRLRASLGGRVHEWEGVIDRVEGEIDVRTRMVFAVARVEDPYGRTAHTNRPPLASGLFVEADILGSTVRDVFVLPRTALRDANTVLVLDNEQRLHRRTVEVARAERQDVVISQGLQDGEVICTSPLDVYVEGMRVRTAEGEGKESTRAPHGATEAGP